MKVFDSENKEEARGQMETSDFWMIIQDVFQLEDKGCVVVGTVAGAAVHNGDEVIIRKMDGTKVMSKILGIELYGKHPVVSADPDMPVGIRLEGVLKTDIAKGDRMISAEAEDVVEKIKNAATLYVLFEKKTGLPFTGMHCAEVYTKKEYAEQAVAHYAKAYPTLIVKECSKEEGKHTGGLALFAYFYYLGLEEVIIDNGVTGVMIRRSEVLAPPDWSSLPENKVPVTNPKLRFQLNCYLAELGSHISYEGQKQLIEKLEKDAMEGLRAGNYLMPVKKKEDSISVPLLTDQQGKQFQPLFTDWLEFEKIYDKNEWGGMVCTFKEGISMGHKKDGVVINALGENMTFGKETIENLFQDLVE